MITLKQFAKINHYGDLDDMDIDELEYVKSEYSYSMQYDYDEERGKDECKYDV